VVDKAGRRVAGREEQEQGWVARDKAEPEWAVLDNRVRGWAAQVRVERERAVRAWVVRAKQEWLEAG
jgi:hypothetical protein